MRRGALHELGARSDGFGHSTRLGDLGHWYPRRQHSQRSSPSPARRSVQALGGAAQGRYQITRSRGSARGPNGQPLLSCPVRQERNPPLDNGAKYSIRHALCTTARDEATRLHHFICLYRSSADKAFSEEERRLKEFLAPHLIEARHNNLLAHFNRHKQGAYLSGVCDQFGLLHQMEPGFEKLLRSEWPDSRLPYLPSDLGAAAAKSREGVFEAAHTVFKLAPLGDLIHIQARKKSRLAQLSARERLITKHLVAGQTYKQIAHALNISPSTVTKHVNSIYKKTGAKNKTQLAKIIEQAKDKNFNPN